jgi:hypothetical protein
MVADWVIYFAFERESAWASNFIAASTTDALARVEFITDLLSFAMHAMQPRRLKDGRGSAASIRASRWLVALVQTLQEATRGAPQASPEERDRVLGAAHQIVGHVVQSAYVNVIRRNDANDRESELGIEELKNYYETIRPILETVLSFSEARHTGGIAAPTAHSFMELLGVLLPVAPTQVVETAAALASVARGGGYHFDSLAVREVVRLVETILADYREQFTEGAPLAALLSLLDVFAEAGWPEATSLVWRLDEVFR